MPFFYASGEKIEPGDRVTYGGEPGEVEFVADPLVDPNDWYVTEHGGGVMITAFGAVFISDPSDDEDLVLVSRKPDGG